MSKYIDAEKLIAEIQRHIKHYETADRDDFKNGELYICHELLSFIASLQQEQPEVELKKLGEIARHLIAVKDHEEDMRLDEGEWLLLERIGYPERFNIIKEESISVVESPSKTFPRVNEFDCGASYRH